MKEKSDVFLLLSCQEDSFAPFQSVVISFDILPRIEISARKRSNTLRSKLIVRWHNAFMQTMIVRRFPGKPNKQQIIARIRRRSMRYPIAMRIWK